MNASNESLGKQAHAEPDAKHGTEHDLKFVPVQLGTEPAGGWYRELPDAQIEVMSRAHLERVPLNDSDAEDKARETIAEILTRHCGLRTQ